MKTKEEYDYIRTRLLAAYGALENVVKNHAEVKDLFPVPVDEIISQIKAAHARCWELAPEKTKSWHLNQLKRAMLPPPNPNN